MMNSSKLITKDIIHSKSMVLLKEVYHILSEKNGNNLTRQQLENYIYNELNSPIIKVNNMTVENKTKDKFTPKDIAKEYKISPAALRKILRKNFNKPEGGNWSLSSSDVEKLLKLYQEDRERATENKSHNIERLKAAREAKKAAQTNNKEAPAKKASIKK